jgi:predicted methyltransferase
MKNLLKFGLVCILTTVYGQAFAIDNHSATHQVEDDKLQAVLAQQTKEAQARYQYRHPYETLKFFGIKPGMTVVETLPYSGWYTKIIAPYLGKEGHMIAGEYPVDLWKLFEWADDNYIQERIKDTETFPQRIKLWAPTDTPTASAYSFDAMPATLNNTVDAVLFVRSLHNINRFNASHQYGDNILKTSYRILKPGGIVGIVQHQSALKNLTGETGYLNRDELVASVEKAGFTLVAESDINKNSKDQPTAEDYVWRLPPGLDADTEEDKQRTLAIGESNRMTLLFKK